MENGRECSGAREAAWGRNGYVQHPRETQLITNKTYSRKEKKNYEPINMSDFSLTTARLKPKLKINKRTVKISTALVQTSF